MTSESLAITRAPESLLPRSAYPLARLCGDLELLLALQDDALAPRRVDAHAVEELPLRPPTVTAPAHHPAFFVLEHLARHSRLSIRTRPTIASTGARAGHPLNANGATVAADIRILTACPQALCAEGVVLVRSRSGGRDFTAPAIRGARAGTDQPTPQNKSAQSAHVGDGSGSRGGVTTGLSGNDAALLDRPVRGASTGSSFSSGGRRRW